MKNIIYALPTILQRFIWPGTRAVLSFFSCFSIIGARQLENLPKGLVFAPNHSSELDPILVPAALPFFSRHLGMFYTSREKKYYINSGWRQLLYGGWFFKIWGAYPVQTGVQNYEVSLKHHIKLLENLKSVCIFPEGKTTQTGKIGEAKGGVGYLTWRTGKPIIPVTIVGTYKMGLKDFFLRKRNITIIFGSPVYWKDIFPGNKKPEISLTHDDCRVAAQKIMNTVSDTLKSFTS